MKTKLSILAFLAAFTLSACDQEVEDQLNTCELDSDCQFVEFTGSCHTPEYTQVLMIEAQEKDIDTTATPPRVPPQPDTVCECRENKCALKNS